MKISSNRNIRNIIKDGKVCKDILLDFAFFYKKKNNKAFLKWITCSIKRFVCVGNNNAIVNTDFIFYSSNNWNAIFVQIHIFGNIIKKIAPRWNIVFPGSYYRKHYNLNILHIFSYHVHSVQFCIFKSPINV